MSTHTLDEAQKHLAFMSREFNTRGYPYSAKVCEKLSASQTVPKIFIDEACKELHRRSAKVSSLYLPFFKLLNNGEYKLVRMVAGDNGLTEQN